MTTLTRHLHCNEHQLPFLENVVAMAINGGSK
jgi:hypothetical protein